MKEDDWGITAATYMRLWEGYHDAYPIKWTQRIALAVRSKVMYIYEHITSCKEYNQHWRARWYHTDEWKVKAWRRRLPTAQCKPPSHRSRVIVLTCKSHQSGRGSNCSHRQILFLGGRDVTMRRYESLLSNLQLLFIIFYYLFITCFLFEWFASSDPSRIFPSQPFLFPSILFRSVFHFTSPKYESSKDLRLPQPYIGFDSQVTRC
jgi:hypothetical protein